MAKPHLVDLDELLAGMRDLLDVRAALARARIGEGNFRCEDCEGCSDCRFCRGCRDCDGCTYCEGCSRCERCTQCRDSVDCADSAYLEASAGCRDARYLVLCVDCERCTHCLGCVGLADAEFHVLNAPMGRKEYLELVKRVRDELQRRPPEDWRPAWLEPAAADPRAPRASAELAPAAAPTPGESGPLEVDAALSDHSWLVPPQPAHRGIWRSSGDAGTGRDHEGSSTTSGAAERSYELLRLVDQSSSAIHDEACGERAPATGDPRARPPRGSGPRDEASGPIRREPGSGSALGWPEPAPGSVTRPRPPERPREPPPRPAGAARPPADERRGPASRGSEGGGGRAIDAPGPSVVRPRRPERG